MVRVKGSKRGVWGCKLSPDGERWKVRGERGEPGQWWDRVVWGSGPSLDWVNKPFTKVISYDKQSSIDFYRFALMYHRLSNNYMKVLILYFTKIEALGTVGTKLVSHNLKSMLYRVIWSLRFSFIRVNIVTLMMCNLLV